MKFLTDNKDALGLLLQALGVVVALVAIALSITTVIVQVVAQVKQRRHDAFRHIHELLIEPDIQRGRRIAYRFGAEPTQPDYDSDEWRLMNRAIGVFDTLGTYYERHLVPRQLVLEVWHHSLREIRQPAMHISDYRLRDLQSWKPWPHLWRLLDQADTYRSKSECCKPPATPRNAIQTQHQSTAANPAGPSSQESQRPACRAVSP